MKPNVLVLLLLTITPVICTLLASETAEKPAATPVLSSDSSAKPAPAKGAPAAPTVAAPASRPATSTAASEPAAASGAGSLKGWYMLW